MGIKVVQILSVNLEIYLSPIHIQCIVLFERAACNA